MNHQPRRRFAHSLAGQMVALVAGILLLAMGTNAYLQYRDEVSIVENNMRTRAQSLSEILAAVSIDNLLVYDIVTLNDHVADVIMQPQVVFAAVLDLDGKALTNRLNLQNIYVSQAVTLTGSKDPILVADELKKYDALLFHKVPVVFNGETLAYVVVVLDSSEYANASVVKFQVKALSTILIGLMVGIGIFWAFHSKILRPLKQLTEGAENISQARFDQQLKVTGNNELTDLFNSFNHMSAYLKELIAERDRAFAKMEELNHSLEDRVHERTLELQALNAEMAHQAMHDPLTNLPNRTLLMERLQQSIRMAKRHSNRVAFIMLDLNNFKEVNDTLGHPEGDRLLVAVAERLPSVLRDTDTVGRLGGDEFGIVLPDVDAIQAELVAYKIISTMAPSFSLDTQVVSVGASIGIAMYPDHGEDHTALIRHADVAMYDSKRKDGKPRFYDPNSDQYTTQRLALMADLHQAIEKDQLELHYQPQVDLKYKKVIAVEGLLRWHHPVHGHIPPVQFIHMAESGNLINLLSDWVLKTAIKQLAIWKQQNLNIGLSINLSARDLLNPELPHYIGQLSTEHNVALDKLAIEITESAIMSNPEKAMEVISHPLLSTLHYAIDDFGTGYSSLSYLKKLPVDEVKIDKSFVMDMANDDEDASIVRSVIDLTHNLGHIVVAEGVEDARTLDMLTALGCDIAQGFYFSKAVPAAQLADVIDRIEANFRNQI